MKYKPLASSKKTLRIQNIMPRRSKIHGQGHAAQRKIENRRDRTARYERHHGSARQRGYDSRWERESKAYLEQYPLCAECARCGHTTPATLVDHVVPHKGDTVLFWLRSNWQALCVPCHGAKTVRENVPHHPRP